MNRLSRDDAKQHQYHDEFVVRDPRPCGLAPTHCKASSQTLFTSLILLDYFISQTRLSRSFLMPNFRFSGQNCEVFFLLIHPLNPFSLFWVDQSVDSAIAICPLASWPPFFMGMQWHPSHWVNDQCLDHSCFLMKLLQSSALN